MAAGEANNQRRLLFYMLTFFASMALMEVVQESASRELRGLESYLLGMVLTCGQFLGCAIVAYMQMFFSSVTGSTPLPEMTTKDHHFSSSSFASWRDFERLWRPYVTIFALIYVGTGCANISVFLVQYPVKVVFKSSKLIPVMLVSVTMQNSRSFTSIEYLAAVLICCGTALFSLHSGREDAEEGMQGIGIALLVVSCIADAVGANAQQRLMQQGAAVRPEILMWRTNLVGFVGSFALLIATGHGFGILAYVLKETRILGYAMSVGMILGVGVSANVRLINEAGAVVATGVATLRKAFTMMMSYFLFPKPLEVHHAIACLVLAAGLVLSSHGKDSLACCRRKPLKSEATTELV